MSTSHAFATVEALRIVLREEQPPAMAEVLHDMERARMTAEDCRGAMVSPYAITRANTTTRSNTDPSLRFLSWKEFGERITLDVIEPAMDALDHMRRDMRTDLTAHGIPQQPGYKALETAHNDIRRIQSFIHREIEDEYETESE